MTTQKSKSTKQHRNTSRSAKPKGDPVFKGFEIVFCELWSSTMNGWIVYDNKGLPWSVHYKTHEGKPLIAFGLNHDAKAVQRVITFDDLSGHSFRLAWQMDGLRLMLCFKNRISLSIDYDEETTSLHVSRITTTSSK